MQDHDRATPRIEASEYDVNHVPIRDVGRMIGLHRHMYLGDRDLDRPPTTTPKLIEARVHRQPIEPGVEPIRVTQTSDVAPCSKERLLDRVAGELRVAQDESGGDIQADDRAVDKRGVGVLIATLDAFHE